MEGSSDESPSRTPETPEEGGGFLRQGLLTLTRYCHRAMVSAPMFIGLSSHAFITGLLLGVTVRASALIRDFGDLGGKREKGRLYGPVYSAHLLPRGAASSLPAPVAPSIPFLYPGRTEYTFSIPWALTRRAVGWPSRQKHRSDVLVVFWAIVAHKTPETLSFASKLIKEGMCAAHTVATVVLFSLVTPLGIATGTCTWVAPLQPKSPTPAYGAHGRTVNAGVPYTRAYSLHRPTVYTGLHYKTR
eukprot:1179317-Prorocentrum_minimum.AAC.8